MKNSLIPSTKLAVGASVLSRIGVTRGAGSGSDFTAAATEQVFVLSAIQPGDIVQTSLARIDVISPVVHASTFTARLGIAGDDDRFIGPALGTDVKLTTAKVIVANAAALADALPYVNNTANPVNLILTVRVGAGTVATASAGELQVLVPISRALDRVTQMEA